MKVEGPSIAHVRAVAENMRDEDAAEFLAVSFAADRQSLADQLVQNYGSHPDTYCFSDGDEPVGVGAMVNGRPNVITLMFFATPAFPRIALPLARFCRQRLFPNYQRAGVHRIECVSAAEYVKNHRWIEVLGLDFEAELHGFGRRGETFYQFAWVDQSLFFGAEENGVRPTCH